MMQPQPMIVVSDVEAASTWFQDVLGLRSAHGGEEYEMLMDGDVMVAAGDVAYTAGRESIAQYNESLAGARVPGFVGVGGPRHVDALRPDGTLLKYVSNISELALAHPWLSVGWSVA